MCLVYVVWDAEKRESGSGAPVPFDGAFKCVRRVFSPLLHGLVQREEPVRRDGRRLIQDTTSTRAGQRVAGAQSDPV